MWLKKIHERVGLAPNFSWRAKFGGPGFHRGWGPQTPKFFWEVQEVPIGPPGKIKDIKRVYTLKRPHFEDFIQVTKMSLLKRLWYLIRMNMKENCPRNCPKIDQKLSKKYKIFHKFF